MTQINKKFLIYLLAGLLVINLGLLIYFSLSPFSQSARSENLKIVFFDVGQGDAILVQTPARQNILIDGGIDKGIIYKLDQHIPFYRRKIDLMILTHPHPDHLNGLIEVLKRYRVEHFLFNGVSSQIVEYQQLLSLLNEKEISREIVWQGKKIYFNQGYLEFIFPFESLAGQSFRDENEGSLVFKLVFNETKVLFTGDATKNIEKQLIEKNIDLSADILKVAHHGSKDSSIIEFLERVKPIYAVVSVGGDNKYGHPALRVQRNLAEVGAEVLRTDQLGDIIFNINYYDANLQMKCQSTNCEY